jgi:hypothetical protein
MAYSRWSASGEQVLNVNCEHMLTSADVEAAEGVCLDLCGVGWGRPVTAEEREELRGYFHTWLEEMRGTELPRRRRLVRDGALTMTDDTRARVNARLRENGTHIEHGAVLGVHLYEATGEGRPALAHEDVKVYEPGELADAPVTHVEQMPDGAVSVERTVPKRRAKSRRGVAK